MSGEFKVSEIDVCLVPLKTLEIAKEGTEELDGNASWRQGHIKQSLHKEPKRFRVISVLWPKNY